MGHRFTHLLRQFNEYIKITNLTPIKFTKNELIKKKKEN